MSVERSRIYRYSEAFKKQVMDEIESGKYTIHQAKKVYGIKGESTINYWIKKANRKAIMTKVVRIEKASEVSKIKELEDKLRQMEKAMSHLVVENGILKATVSLAEERGYLVKKKTEKK